MAEKEYTAQYLFDFISEQVKKGLFKSNIVDKLLDLGVKKDTADELVALFYEKLKGESKRLILVVDDEKESRELVGEILKRAGYRIILAVNGQEGITKTRMFLPDLIITDVLMPQMNGKDLIENLKGTFIAGKIPIIVTTVRGPMKDFFDALEVDGFIEKPLDAGELLRMVGELIQKTMD